jgi:hypothetical protein
MTTIQITQIMTKKNFKKPFIAETLYVKIIKYFFPPLFTLGNFGKPRKTTWAMLLQVHQLFLQY